MRRAVVPCAGAAGGLACALGARTAAAVECVALPTPVYVTGSTAAKPLLAEIGKVMAGQTPPATSSTTGSARAPAPTRSCPGRRS